MKKLIILAAVLFVVLLSSCKTAEECPKAYSQHIEIEAGR